MPAISRRDALKLVGGATLGLGACGRQAATAATLQATGDRSLAALAAGKGLRFGAAIDRNQLADPAYTDLIRRECSVIVAENEHKMYVIQPEPDVWDFAPADAIMTFARDARLGVRGHTLLWNYPRWLPDWVNGQVFRDALEAERFLTAYAGRVAARYSPAVYSWDVVNETLNDETGEMRDTVFTRAMGGEAVDHCFRVAREFAPDAALAYNDYMSWDDSSAAHRTGVLRLLERLLANDVPIDALGIQAHIMLDPDNPFTPEKQRNWRAFLDEVSGMGLDLYVTELDANDRLAGADQAARDAGIAAYTKDYLDILLSYPNTRDVLLWGMVDRYSWLQDFREDGEPAARPLPYDDDYRPKPMRGAIAAALRAAPAR